MSHYSLNQKRAAVEVYRYAKRLKDNHEEKSINPEELALIAAGGASRSSLFDWLNTNLDSEDEDSPEETRGRHRSLTLDQEHLLVGFACWARIGLQNVSLEILTNFCISHLDASPSLPTISRIMYSYGFSSQKSLARNSRMISLQVVEDALQAIDEIRSFNFPPHRIIAMDETGLWSNVTSPRTYHFKNW
jgi:hypothetical protein